MAEEILQLKDRLAERGEIIAKLQAEIMKDKK
jgi:hypothetical protein